MNADDKKLAGLAVAGVLLSMVIGTGAGAMVINSGWRPSVDVVNVGLVLSALSIAIGINGMVWRMRPRVLRLRDDPPPNAHYIELDPDTAEDDDESKARKAQINKQKEAEVIYHSLHYCDGRCSRRELHETINREWNSFYEDWPEYKKYWHISEKFIRDTLDKYDFKKTGDVVTLAGDYAGAFVIIDDVVNGSSGRRLINVADLVYTYLKPPEPEIKATETSPETGADASEAGAKHSEFPIIVGYDVPQAVKNGATLPMAAD